MRRNPQALIGEEMSPADDTPAPIALTTLAAELPDLTISELLAQIGDDVFIEQQTGIRCVSVATCKRVIDEQAEGARRRAKVSAEAEAKILASLPKPTRYVTDEHFQEIANHGLKTAGQR